MSMPDRGSRVVSATWFILRTRSELADIPVRRAVRMREQRRETRDGDVVSEDVKVGDTVPRPQCMS